MSVMRDREKWYSQLILGPGKVKIFLELVQQRESTRKKKSNNLKWNTLN